LLHTLRKEPVPNVFILHLAYKTGLRGTKSGAAFLGHFDKADRLIGVGVFGGSLLTWGTDPTTLTLLKNEALRRQSRWQSLLGDHRTISPLWTLLAPHLDPPAEDRTELWLSLSFENFQPTTALYPVRPARDADLPRILQLRRGLYEEPEGRRLSVYDEDRLRRRCRDGIRDGVSFVAEVEGEVVFIASYSASTPEVTQISSVYTHPERRGRGIATNALSYLCQYALRRSERVSLFVAEENDAARRIYHRLGFQETALARSIRLSESL
jgi:ribosomal protein S18 acetylase RimI-like enzyme